MISKLITLSMAAIGLFFGGTGCLFCYNLGHVLSSNNNQIRNGVSAYQQLVSVLVCVQVLMRLCFFSVRQTCRQSTDEYIQQGLCFLHAEFHTPELSESDSWSYGHSFLQCLEPGHCDGQSQCEYLALFFSLPSGKHTNSYGKPPFYMVNQL